MLRALPTLAALALATGCSFDVDYGDTAFQCEVTPDCPDGFTCVDDECRRAGGDGAPTAAFTSDASFLLVSLDATSSSDPDGDALDHAWSFGDDSTGTGATISHTYDAEGSYDVTLTVTDDDGNTDSVSNQVMVMAPAQPIAKDGFERSVDPGWGMADIGGGWTLTGEASKWRVVEDRGRSVVDAGSGLAARLLDVSTDTADATISFSVDKVSTGSGLYFTLLGRRLENGDGYDVSVVLQPDSEVAIRLGKTLGGDDSTVDAMTVPGLLYAPGTVLHLRAQIFGTDPTTVRGRVWADGTDEPGAWQLTTEDSEPALQEPGMFGLNSYLSSSASNGPIEVTYDDLLVVPVE